MRLMKKVLSMGLVLCMSAALVACGGSKEEPAATTSNSAAGGSTATTEASGDAVKAVWCSAMNNESQAFAYKMFQQYCGEYNVTVDVLDDNGDAAKQADNVAQAVAQGYQWIIVNPTDAAGIVTAFKAAKEANPDVIISTFSSDVPEGDGEQYRDFFVGINDTMAGQQAGEAFVSLFPDGAKLVEIGGQAGHNAQILRHDGFNEIMDQHSEFEILGVQNTEHWAADEAQSIAEDFITTYGKDIQGIFCHWDNGATGIITALAAAGIEGIPIVGVDGCRAGFEQVEAGDQYATIMNNFEAQAILSLQLVTDLIAGNDIEKVNFTTPDVVTQDNIADFTVPEW